MAANPETTACLLLAAGLSRRFGAEDKLSACLDGRPLIHHAAQVLAAIPFGLRLTVTGRDGPDLAPFGFERVINDVPELGQSQSIRLGVEAMAEGPWSGLLIALGDMPHITEGHVRAILDAGGGEEIVASAAAGKAMPPAWFPRSRFAELTRLSGDQGARTLLRDARLVQAPADVLADVDSPADLKLLEVKG
jgi:molybdenum cofactor cytidylyltransferase